MIKTAKIILVLLSAVLVVVNADGNPKVGFVQAARQQIGTTIRYDARYRVLEYPNGDVPMDRGVCTDVIVRAMRSAFGIDLQQLVHEDMKRNFLSYPHRWGLKSPDRNIDHRRVPNLRTFFKRQGWELSISQKAEDYAPGDIVVCMVPLRRPHIMVVSNRKNGDGVPLVIHNIGAGAQEEDRLFEFKHTGHFRINSSKPSRRPQ